MEKVINKKILSLTINSLVNVSLEDTLLMIKNNLDEVSSMGDEYTCSIAFSIVKKLSLIKNYDYVKYYNIITSLEFRNNKYIIKTLDNKDFKYLKEFIDIYKNKSLENLMDYIFCDSKDLFDEIVCSGYFNLSDIFSLDVVNYFTRPSFKTILSYTVKGNDKKKVIRALLRKKNNKFIYVVSKMDDIVLRHVSIDKDYWDSVLTLLNYDDYRHLLWDYYNKFICNDKNEYLLRSAKYNKEIPDELYELLSYTFNLINMFYSSDRIPRIIFNIDELVKCANESKDIVHTAVFGVEGYKKVRDGTFNILMDFPKLDSEDKLLNLKIAFFSTIYGLTYNQAGKLIKSFNNFMKSYDVSFSEEDQVIYETILAMKSLYNLTLKDKDGISVYRELYYRYVKKRGIHAIIEVEAMVIMEELMRRMYNNSIEIV